MSHVTHRNDWGSVTNMHESDHTYEWVPPHIYMCHVARVLEVILDSDFETTHALYASYCNATRNSYNLRIVMHILQYSLKKSIEN